MDITVTSDEDSPAHWQLTDLLGRAMGGVVESEDGTFSIVPDGKALETMAGLRLGPYASLDQALAHIEQHTRGVCRRS